MNEIQNQTVPHLSTRRQAVTGFAIALSGLIAASKDWGESPHQAMKQTLSTAAIQKRTAIHLEFDLKTSPGGIYDALLDSTKFAAFTGAPATIDSNPGGSFSMFGGLIVGRNIEMIPSQRVVQAWRPTHWAKGVYSIVKFELKPNGLSTTVVLDHTGFPEGEYDHLEFGWRNHYSEPLKKYFA
jgi:activator of HSP90 ATPase